MYLNVYMLIKGKKFLESLKNICKLEGQSTKNLIQNFILIKILLFCLNIQKIDIISTIVILRY